MAEYLRTTSDADLNALLDALEEELQDFERGEGDEDDVRACQEQIDRVQSEIARRSNLPVTSVTLDFAEDDDGRR